MTDTVILPIAQNLLACLCEQLALNPDPPADCCLRAGDVVVHDVDVQSSVDKVCCPGLGYVRVGNMYPSSNFPVADTEPGKRDGCFPVSWAVELTMGTVRCVPGMGSPEGPDCTDWTTAAERDANDMDAMRRALCCWQPTLRKGALWLAGASTVALTADCIERQMQVLVSVPRCC